MRIDVLTIFPELVTPHLAGSLIGRAVEKGVLDVRVTDIRDHADNRHRQVDDTVYGGGPGMVMVAQVVAAALDATTPPDARRLYMTPTGRRLDQRGAHALCSEAALTVLCGRYEGVDQRVLDEYGFEPVSIGDYVVAGGEIPALVLIEAVTRLLPGVMGNAASAETETFEDGLLEPPSYTRPREWRGRGVPDELTGGDHAVVQHWRRLESLRLTARRRPDLLAAALEDGRVDASEIDEAGIDRHNLAGP